MSTKLCKRAPFCHRSASGAQSSIFFLAFLAMSLNTDWLLLLKGLWRNGSASDSRSEGWEFKSLWPHFPFSFFFSSSFSLLVSALTLYELSMPRCIISPLGLMDKALDL